MMFFIGRKKWADFLSFCYIVFVERRFSDSHEWCQVDDNLVATVGLSAFAEHAIGNAVFIELPDLGKDLEKGGK